MGKVSSSREQARRARGAEVAAVARQLEATGRLGLTRTFMQHGSVSVYAHVCAVARASLGLADALARTGISCDRISLVRGALLHDYFLYDWHVPGPENRHHAVCHPFVALANAEEDFELSARERTIISRHMFPLVILPPTCREAWLVCIADKWCALRETLFARRAHAGQACSGAADVAGAAPGGGR